MWGACMVQVPGARGGNKPVDQAICVSCCMKAGWLHAPCLPCALAPLLTIMRHAQPTSCRMRMHAWACMHVSCGPTHRAAKDVAQRGHPLPQLRHHRVCFRAVALRHKHQGHFWLEITAQATSDTCNTLLHRVAQDGLAAQEAAPLILCSPVLRRSSDSGRCGLRGGCRIAY